MSIIGVVSPSTIDLAGACWNQDQNHLNVCIPVPPHLTSKGLWADHSDGRSPFKSSATILQLQILTIVVTTQCFHFLLKRFLIPHFISSVLTGFVLGPTLKYGQFYEYKKLLFPFGSEDTLQLISLFGYTFYLFLTYVQMDFSRISRTGSKAWAIAISSLIPIVAGFAIIIGLASSLSEQVIIGMPPVFISHSICSFPVIAGLLNELQILNSEIGRLALSSSLLLDISGNIVQGIGTALITAEGIGPMAPISSVVKVLGLFFFVIIVGRHLMKWIVRHTPEGRPVRKIYIYTIVLLVLLLGVLENKLKQPFFGGAIMLGLAVPEGPPLGSELVNQLELVSTWFLTPIFLTSCIMKVNLSQIDVNQILVVVGFIIMVTLVKIVSCVGICRYRSMPTIDSICIALIMSCKGVVDICTYVLLYEAKKYNETYVGVMVISGLILATISKIGVKFLYDPSRKYAGYQRRNILYLKPNTELRIVACIHKPCHISPIRNFLELLSPTTTNPMVVDVMHLMELVGRSTPIFISHRDQLISGVSEHNFSGEIILTFSLLEHEFAGAATVNPYTAISPFTSMHDDICYLAMDKVASFIILPFHIRWTNDGTVESCDNNIRSLNCKVLEKAPCSIGILVNRGSSSFNSSYHKVAIIFIGGADDREALCWAKRSAKESNIRLSMFHLMEKESDMTNWDTLLDAEVLRDVQGIYGSVENMTYDDITIYDASQITSFLNTVVNEFDFIIVGRRIGIKSSITTALLNWTEFSELGVIGDLLASPDVDSGASILVVQQQQTK
ncbi:hypothetical protein RIF29_20296 [Crotalaria pallida]|uniref:Cation/H+ exchanger domain-containing protein n=1 Tax=Crotalaria pallida TaxID=3830 RepID=A0AAN9F9E4_CROPI